MPWLQFWTQGICIHQGNLGELVYHCCRDIMSLLLSFYAWKLAEEILKSVPKSAFVSFHIIVCIFSLAGVILHFETHGQERENKFLQPLK